MSTATYHVGDTRTVTATLDDNSVDLVLTSPPFLALRSYLPDDHTDKASEIGSEPDPAAFIDVLLELTAEWGRVLAPHGSIAVELGDTYSGETCDGWPLPKSLALVPELYRVALAYGINPLTGAPSPAGRWRIRNVVRWVRPNPPVGALGDKYRPATSEMVIATRSKDRWFDLDAVRGPSIEPAVMHVGEALASRGISGGDSGNPDKDRLSGNPNGAPPLDWWKISPGGYPGAHYATFPPELCEIPIKSMVPRHVCTTCGEPRRRIVSEPEYVRTDTDKVPARLAMNDGTRPAKGVNQHSRADGANTSVTRQTETLGWTDCGHDTWRPGVVLDPFAGTGTTLAVATGHSRDAIGIDIDERNADLARERVGMFLTIAESPTT